uniref:Uncharacterized protein n=1 Tax=Rhizophora mucronata TaxID=61149 RepID=A0A2P2NUC1_RHIMU
MSDKSDFRDKASSRGYNFLNHVALPIPVGIESVRIAVDFNHI